MRECFAHGTRQCLTCKCTTHNKTDCLDSLCSQIKDAKIAGEYSNIYSHSSQPSISLSQTRRNSLPNDKLNTASKYSNPQAARSANFSIPHMSANNSTSAPQSNNLPPNQTTNSNNMSSKRDEELEFLRNQNSQLLSQVQQLTSQLNTMSQQISELVASSQSQNNNNSKRPRDSTNDSPRKIKKVPSLAQKQLFADQNKFANLSDDMDEDSAEDDNDISLGSDDGIFINPGNLNPVVNSAINRIKKTKAVAKKTKTIEKNKINDKKDDNNSNPNVSVTTSSANSINSSQSTENKTRKLKKPPPIYTAIKTNFNDLCKALNKIDSTKWSSTVLSNDSFKINSIDDETHNLIIKELQTVNIYFNTFENKNIRPIRVLVKGLHHDTSVTNIINSLKASGFKPLNATANLKRIVEYPGKNQSDTPLNVSATSKETDKSTNTTPDSVPNNEISANDPQLVTIDSDASAEPSGGDAKVEGTQGKTGNDTNLQSIPPVIKYQPLNTFTVSFDHSDNIEKIFEIKTIANMRVMIEPIPSNSPLTPIQCKKCQGYNHSSNFCNYPPRCVKCSGEHMSFLCEKPKYIPDPKCVNCGGNHAASYRGCLIAKTITEQRRELFKKIEEKKAIRTGQQVTPAASTLKKGVSFRDAFRNDRSFPKLNNTSQEPATANQNDNSTNSQNPQHQPQDRFDELFATMSQILDSVNNLAQRVATLENKLQVRPDSTQRSLK
nr:PREDICTED: rho GTPase-activating protein gacF-like [Bemisia tabaci]